MPINRTHPHEKTVLHSPDDIPLSLLKATYRALDALSDVGAIHHRNGTGAWFRE